ncbi:MAG: single-stranded DNA-binding protein [Saprospirales bacterium]|nr:MAG: single-stranded DNA-binding protein [Saprospirales bacterium]
MTHLSNHVQLIGHLGQDPEFITFDNGNNLCKINVAVNEYYKDKAGNKQTNTSWHRVVAWGKTAELMNQLLRKGSKVALTGKMVRRDYEDKSGNTRYVVEVQADQFLNLSPVNEKVAV